jgi:hypothetical protein
MCPMCRIPFRSCGDAPAGRAAAARVHEPKASDSLFSMIYRSMESLEPLVAGHRACHRLRHQSKRKATGVGVVLL